MMISVSWGEIAFVTIVQIFLTAGITAWVNYAYSKRLESYKWTIKIREQAAKAAEYMAIAWRLMPDDPPEVYRRVNELAWELAFWLPQDIYKLMTHAIATGNAERGKSMLTVVCRIRSLLQSDPAAFEPSGELKEDDIVWHAPNAGLLPKAPSKKFAHK
jgi:hypothetical protein